MTKSRSDKAIKNTSVAIAIHIVNIFIKFGVRYIFTIQLGKEYLGVNGVFTSIISILSLTEMGLGTAIIYDMYKPAQNNDYDRLNSLTKLFRNVYRSVGAIIILLGVLCLPFINYIIKEVPNVDNIKLIYVLFIVDTGITYFFAHNKSLLDVYQDSYVHILNTFIFDIVKSILQIAVLFIFQDFILYLCVQLASNFFCGFALQFVSKHRYPNYSLRNAQTVDSSEKKKILKNATSIMSIKIGSTLLSSGDNIILSVFVNTVAVGLYSNYALIISAVQSTLFSAVNALLPSIGNLYASEGRERCKRVFGQLMYVYTFVYCFSSVCIILIASDFISGVFGPEYLLDEYTVIFATLSFYVGGVIQVLQNFNTVNGLFVRFRFKPWIEAAVNIIVSILFVKLLGIGGVFAGTVVARLTTSVWYDSYILYKYSFCEKPYEYYRNFIIYFSQFAIIIVTSIIAKKLFVKFDSFYLSVVASLLIGVIFGIGGQVLMNIRNINQKEVFNLLRNKIKR